MPAKNLVGAATRYIAGRNAVQTVYWRGASKSTELHQKFNKVSKTLHLGKSQDVAPQRIRQEHIIRF